MVDKWHGFVLIEYLFEPNRCIDDIIRKMELILCGHFLLACVGLIL